MGFLFYILSAAQHFYDCKMDYLDKLEAETITILREAKASLQPLCMLWSMGKDSTALLWAARKAFLGEVPFPVVLLDTGMELPEVYEFRDQIAKEWKLDIRNEECPPESATDPTLPPQSRAAARKTEGLKNFIAREKVQGVIAGIRRDEQATRAKERVFSPRRNSGEWDVLNQPPELWGTYMLNAPVDGHIRVHPLLNWSEIDIWRYTQRENIPYVPLYLAQNGMRYRSLGEKNITKPVKSSAGSIDAIIEELENSIEPERAGRSMDHEAEDSFERLRRAGYM
jgi:sulfate adenylyltransferase subunit 2